VLRALFLTCLAARLGAMGVLPWGAGAAVERAGADFRAGDDAAAARELSPWIGHSRSAAREALALRFLDQDYAGVLDLAAKFPEVLSDDETRLWAARAAADLGRWKDCLARLDTLAAPDRPGVLALRAEALAEAGDPAAVPAFSRALSATVGTRWEASTELLAAQASEEAGDDADAERLYKTAEKSDPSYTLVNLRLAALYRRQERWKEARQRLERARHANPAADGPRESLDALMAAIPDQRTSVGRDETDRRKRFVERPCPKAVPAPTLPGEPRIRVGIAPEVDEAVFKLGCERGDAAQGLTLGAGSVWKVRPWRDGKLRLEAVGSKEAPLIVEAPLNLEASDPCSTFGLYGVDRGVGAFFSGRQDRYYRGSLRILRSGAKISVVNALGLEAYLRSVVSSEMAPSWPLEAQKAQAVAARTFAWGWLLRSQAREYDACATDQCTVYTGVGAEDPRTAAAVTATAGWVLQDASGRLSSAHYMDNSGGHTLADGEVWPGGTPASVGVADCPADAKATRALFPVGPAGLLHFLDDGDGDVRSWVAGEGHSAWRWTLRLTSEEIDSGLAGRGIGSLRRVRTLERSDGGFVRKALLEGDRGSLTPEGDRIRGALKGLKANLFYVETRLDTDGSPKAFLFHGGGWGHGVGMSQYGAKAMAAAGKGFREILGLYFPKDRLVDRYAVSGAMAPAGGGGSCPCPQGGER